MTLLSCKPVHQPPDKRLCGLLEPVNQTVNVLVRRFCQNPDLSALDSHLLIVIKGVVLCIFLCGYDAVFDTSIRKVSALTQSAAKTQRMLTQGQLLYHNPPL